MGSRGLPHYPGGLRLVVAESVLCSHRKMDNWQTTNDPLSLVAVLIEVARSVIESLESRPLNEPVTIRPRTNATVKQRTHIQNGDVGKEAVRVVAAGRHRDGTSACP